MKTRVHIIAKILIFILNSSYSIAQSKKNKVLIIGMDGIRTDALSKAKTPTLDSLKSKGKFFNNVKILSGKNDGSDTLSGPGWSNILSGYWPDKHLVKDNTFSQNNLHQFLLNKI